MPGRLQHRVAVVTGGGSGIGMESSLLFASEGCLVIVADIDGKAAERTVEKIKQQSCPDKCPAPIAVQCDVGKEEDVKALVEKAVDAGKRLDVIFNKSVVHSLSLSLSSTPSNLHFLYNNAEEMEQIPSALGSCTLTTRTPSRRTKRYGT
jgi:NAD(P)-dependent dehydrogenase (short-subunit alcohol dehydrogenase family)